MKHAAVLFITALLLLPQFVMAQKTPKPTGKALQKLLKQEARKAQKAKEVILPVRQWEREVAATPSTSEVILPVRQWERPQETKALSLVEKAELTNQLELIENLRRALQKDPAIIVKPKFAKQMESLNKLGISMPQITPWQQNASAKNKEAFVADLQNRIETALNKAQTDIATKLGYKLPDLNLQQVIKANHKDLLLARGRHEQKWEVLQTAIEKTILFLVGAPRE